MTADAAPVFDDMTQRLQTAGRAVRDTEEAWKTALQTRDELVVDALDQGMPQRAVARAVGLTHQRVGRLTLPRADQESSRRAG